MKTQNKNNRKKKTAKSESNLGFKEGMLGKLVSKSQQTLTKETAKKKDRRNK